MRATRAYLAGFGTSGSLLAGAALMFLLASAFVAFKGWPDVAGQSSPVAVAIPRSEVPTGSKASRVLAGTLGGRPAGASALRAAGGRAAGAHPRSHFAFNTQVHRSTGSTTVTPTSRDTGSGPHTSGGGPTTHGHPCSSGCPDGQNLLSTIKKTVSNTTSSANSTVTNTITTVKKILPVKSGTGSTVGGVVKTTKNGVGGVTGGLP